MTVIRTTDAAPAITGEWPTVAFGGLRVPTIESVIQPRPWTIEQSVWAEELAPASAPGPILELFAGSGHIGLEASRRTGRPAVLVDRSPEACLLANETVRANGLEATVVNTRVSPDLCASIRPGLILADPPYVPDTEVGRFPADPHLAIDGGPDGLSLVRTVLRCVQPILAPDIPLILQLRGLDQAEAVQEWLGSCLTRALVIDEVRCFGPDRALVVVRPRA